MLAAVLVCIVSTTSSWAQSAPPPDPIIGTWKLDPALTKASAGMPILPPSQRIETYRQNGTGQIELTVTTPNPNGTTTSIQLVFGARGGVVTKGAPAGQMLIETRISPGDWLVTYLANDVQFLTMRKTINSDGTTMRQVVTGVSPQGTPFEGVLVFNRQ